MCQCVWEISYLSRRLFLPFHLRFISMEVIVFCNSLRVSFQLPSHILIVRQSRAGLDIDGITLWTETFNTVAETSSSD